MVRSLRRAVAVGALPRRRRRVNRCTELAIELGLASMDIGKTVLETTQGSAPGRLIHLTLNRIAQETYVTTIVDFTVLAPTTTACILRVTLNTGPTGGICFHVTVREQGLGVGALLVQIETQVLITGLQGVIGDRVGFDDYLAFRVLLVRATPRLQREIA